MSGIVYFYGLFFHQGLLYVNKVLPHNVVMYALHTCITSTWCGYV